MLIDPKNYRFDRLERNVLREALELYMRANQRKLNHLRTEAKRDAVDDRICLASDLLVKLELGERNV